MSLAGVLDDLQIMLACNSKYRIHISRQTVQVNHNDRLGLRCNGRLNFPHIHVDCVEINIHKNGDGIVMDNTRSAR